MHEMFCRYAAFLLTGFYGDSEFLAAAGDCSRQGCCGVGGEKCLLRLILHAHVVLV